MAELLLILLTLGALIGLGIWVVILREQMKELENDLNKKIREVYEITVLNQKWSGRIDVIRTRADFLIHELQEIKKL